MQQNPEAIREAMRLAATPQGQQLLNLLQKSDPAQLRLLMQSAAAGNADQAKAALQAILQDPQAKKLMDQLGGNHGSNGR